MKSFSVLSVFIFAIFLLAGTTSNPEQSQAQSIRCGGTYQVVRGDSLSGCDFCMAEGVSARWL